MMAGGTLSRILSRIQRALQTVLGVYLKRTCSRVTSASSALGVLNDYALYKFTLVGLGRRHDGSRIVVSVDACESGSTDQFSTHMFVHRFGMGSMRRSGQLLSSAALIWLPELECGLTQIVRWKSCIMIATQPAPLPNSLTHSLTHCRQMQPVLDRLATTRARGRRPDGSIVQEFAPQPRRPTFTAKSTCDSNVNRCRCSQAYELGGAGGLQPPRVGQNNFFRAIGQIFGQFFGPRPKNEK